MRRQGDQGHGRAEHGPARGAAAGRPGGRRVSADRVAQLRFPNPAPCGKTPLTAPGLSKSYGSLEVFTDVDLAIDRGSQGRRARAERCRQDDAAADPGRASSTPDTGERRARPRAASSATTRRSTRPSTSSRTVLREHDVGRAGPDRDRGSAGCSGRSCSPATTSTSRPGCCPAARRPGSRWRRWWSRAPTCCCSTSRPTTSTRPARRDPGRAARATRAPSCWSRTTRAPWRP